MKAVLQLTPHDCGVAVTKWILGVYGYKVRKDLEEQLRVWYPPRGVLPHTLVAELRNYGLVAHTYLGWMEPILDQVSAILDKGGVCAALVSCGTPLPNHWVGVCRRMGCISVMDPLSGYRDDGRQEVSEAWLAVGVTRA